MSFGNKYKNRKDKRKRPYGSKSFDLTCKNHGSCHSCKQNKLYSSQKKIEACVNQIKEYRQ